MIKKNACAEKAVHVSWFLAITGTLPAEKVFKKRKQNPASFPQPQQADK